MGHAETGRARTVIIWSVGANEVPPTSDVQRDSETKKKGARIRLRWEVFEFGDVWEVPVDSGCPWNWTIEKKSFSSPSPFPEPKTALRCGTQKLLVEAPA